MALLLVSIGVFLVPWRMMSDRWNKGPAYALGLGIGGLAIASTFLLPHEPTPLIYLVTVVAGIGFSANWVFPWSMVPDVVEYDQLTTGEQRGGMFFGVWGFTNKLTAMLGVVISGLVLQFSGYLPNVAQSAETLQAIRLFFGPVPGRDPGRGAAAAVLVSHHPGQPRRRPRQAGAQDGIRPDRRSQHPEGTKELGRRAPRKRLASCEQV